MSPVAFDQPPEYHAQSTPAFVSSSPIVGYDAGSSGSRRFTAVPGEYGCTNGCVVLTA